MRAKFTGPFVNNEEGSIYVTYVRMDSVILAAEGDDTEFAVYYSYPSSSSAGQILKTDFQFFTADGEDTVPLVDGNLNAFVTRQLSNALTSKAEDVVIPVDYPRPFVTENIYTELN